MSPYLALLADDLPLEVLAKQQVRASFGGIPQIVIFLGIILGVSLLAFLWVAFFRKQRRKRKYRHHHRERNGEATAAPLGVPPAPLLAENHRKRRRRRGRRPRNPTLAETRGLPPPRDQTSTPPY